jgi:4-alpha-glucanotransferase
MNTPGRSENNWRWRLRAGALTPELGRRLLRLGEMFNRAPKHLPLS